MTQVLRKSLLAVFPVAPWPVRDNGISIRFYPLLQRLAKQFAIDLVVLGDFRESLPDDSLLSELRSVNVEYFNRRPPPSLLQRIATLSQVVMPFGAPYAYASYHTQAVYEHLLPMVTRQRYDTLLWVCPFYRDALDRLQPQLRSTRVVFDCVDSPLLTYVRAAAVSAKPSLLTRLDQWKTKLWERRLAGKMDATIYISPVDAGAAFGGKSGHVSVVRNGIFTADFPISLPPPAMPPVLGFLGHMGYQPNIDAAVRLHDEIYLPLRRSFPDLKLMIIGRAPDARVLKLAGPDVVVTGTVENIWEHIAKVSIFAFPLSSGAGLQNKLLEAMYAGRPVVTTEICRSSLGARNGEEILSADTSEGLRDQVRLLLENPALAARISLSGQQFVRDKFELSRVLDEYQLLLFPAE